MGRENKNTSLSFEPETPWNWSETGELTLSVDISNPEAKSTHVMFRLSNASGDNHNSNVLVPAKSSDTYHIVISGGSINIETGMRSSPPMPIEGVTPFVWRYGNKNIDLSEVSALTFSFGEIGADKTLIFDNLTLIPSHPYDIDYMDGVTDAYGQNAFVDFKNKITSDRDLKAKNVAEQAGLDDRLMPDRSRFGGFKNGPKLEATGYFTTAKVKGKWWMVDPEGYLFFSHGLANVRMANTSTITGMDFTDDSVRYKDPNDLTPDDSKGIETVSGEALKTRYVASEMRRDMFSCLPEYDSELGQHFSYRKSTHQGVLEHGETFSFYQANLERKYGESTPNSFIQDWRETTLKRMRNWGFTSFGNWVDPIFYDNKRVPYFANGWIIGDFKTVSTGNDYWSPLPDPFDPEFAVRTRVTIEKIASEVNNSPWCAGIFIDNEKSWGNMGSIESQYAIVINTLGRVASESPTKAVFVKNLQAKYPSINALNQAWSTKFASWDGFANGVTLQDFNDNMVQDFSDMLYLYAAEYFKIVSSELKRAMPNHMYMGVRMASWGKTPEIVRASAEYADVVSYNLYREVMHDKTWAFLAEVDKPSIIGEFHIGSFDTGYFNPGLVFAHDQEERGEMYTQYMKSVLENPYMVGAHWFQYIDSPVTGRAYDGENYNVGFVTVTDTPYQEMVEAAQAFNAKIYSARYEE